MEKQLGKNRNKVERPGSGMEKKIDLLTEQKLYPFLSEERQKTVICLDCVDSTNTYLKRLAKEGAKEGTIIIANEQTAGRGRLGRSFQSKKNTGIYMSMLMHPKGALENISEITAWVAVAVSKAIEQVTGVKPGIKWVNDLVLNGKKICGILTEMASEGESGQVKYLIVGIGINVNNHKEDFQKEIQNIASSIREATGKFISRVELSVAIIRELDLLCQRWPDEKEKYLQYYKEACVTTGKEVRIIQRGMERIGVAENVTEEFHLQIRYLDGTKEIVSNGEVSVRGMYGYV